MIAFHRADFPTLETQRMVLRRATTADVPFLFAMRSSPERMRYIDRPLAESHTDVETLLATMHQTWLANESITWVMEHKASGEAMGTVGYYRNSHENRSGEIGYMQLPKWQGQGYMHEAVLSALRFGFEAGMHRVAANVHPQNERSKLLLYRLGFQAEGVLRENQLFNGQFSDTMWFALLKREFERLHAADL